MLGTRVIVIDLASMARVQHRGTKYLIARMACISSHAALDAYSARTSQRSFIYAFSQFREAVSICSRRIDCWITATRFREANFTGFINPPKRLRTGSG